MGKIKDYYADKKAATRKINDISNAHYNACVNEIDGILDDFEEKHPVGYKLDSNKDKVFGLIKVAGTFFLLYKVPQWIDNAKNNIRKAFKDVEKTEESDNVEFEVVESEKEEGAE